tara:strand:+ start:350 stop:1243 length:894 start_codon:yes stop_codon:yes gene_type:complete
MKIILGTAQLGLDYGITNKNGKPDINTALQIIKTALDNNIIDFDTARGYGDSEKIIGIAKEKYNNMNIITKLDTFPDVNETTRDIIEKKINKSLDDSLKFLKLKMINTLLLHRFSHYNNKIIWDYLLKLRNNKKIKNLGVSVYYVKEAIEALKNVNIKHIQLPINILDGTWFCKEFLELVKKRTDVIIHCRSIFLQGILLSSKEKWPNLDNINPEEYVNKLDKLTSTFNFNNKIELCLSYVKSINWIDGLLMGVDNVSQLKENIKLFNIRKLKNKEFDLIRNTFKNVPENLLNPSMW